MYRRRKLLRFFIGILIGIFIVKLFSFSKTCRQPKTRSSLEQLLQTKGQRPSTKRLLFVGVMTAAKYIDSRAKAIYDTWGEEVPGKILFYSSENTTSDHVPLVALKGVDDSYPPQRKSFTMLKHIHDHFIDQYEWFLRADDDVYIRSDKLEELLRSVDSRKPWFIGQTGRGNTEEFGQLALESDQNFCMGGPGVIMSRETLKRVAPHLPSCLRELVTGHEDVELGRCVRKYAGVSCTWSYEMQVILYHNQSGEAAFTGDLNQKEVHRAITLHPIKQPQHMFRVHKYIKSLRLRKYQQQLVHLHRDVAASMKELGYRLESLDKAEIAPNVPLFSNETAIENYVADPKLLGVPVTLNRFKPKKLEDVVEWELISKMLYSSRDLNPRKRIGSTMKEGLNDIVREVMEVINSYSKQRGRVIDFKEILYGYWRLDPLHGVDVILDLLLVYKKYRGRKMTVQVRRHAYVQQTFTGIFIREVTANNKLATLPATNEDLPVHKKIVKNIFSKLSEKLSPILKYISIPEKTRINFILPLSGRYEIFVRFLKMFEDICIENSERTRLIIVLYKNSEVPSDYQKTLRLLDSVNYRYSKSEIRVIPREDEQFSRGKALQQGINTLLDDDLMLFIDVDIVFNSDTLERIRRNTVRNQSLYFPIVYSLYNPKLLNKTYDIHDYTQYTQKLINDDNGFWRQFGFGIVSLYKTDYVSLGGFNLGIMGWGNEDVTFFDNVVKSNLTIVRSVDPDMFHVYHDVKCDEHLENEQKNMCYGTMASTLGSLNTLQRLFKKYRHLFR